MDIEAGGGGEGGGGEGRQLQTQQLQALQTNEREMAEREAGITSIQRAVKNSKGLAQFWVSIRIEPKQPIGRVIAGPAPVSPAFFTNLGM